LLRDLLQRYRETVPPLKRGAKDKAIRLKALEHAAYLGLGEAAVTRYWASREVTENA